MFHKKKKYRLYLKFHSNNQLLHDGAFLELPFPESLILEKSIQFFDDPEPCYLHRSAVRNRLLYELEEELNKMVPLICESLDGEVRLDCTHCPLLLSYTGFQNADRITAYMA